jgi:hypothetical protein
MFRGPFEVDAANPCAGAHNTRAKQRPWRQSDTSWGRTAIRPTQQFSARQRVTYVFLMRAIRQVVQDGGEHAGGSSQLSAAGHDMLSVKEIASLASTVYASIVARMF